MDFYFFLHFAMEDETGSARASEVTDELVDGLEDLFREWVHGINVSLQLLRGPSPDILVTAFAYGELHARVWENLIDLLLHLYIEPVFRPLKLRNVTFLSDERVDLTLPSICVATRTAFPGVEYLHRVLRQRLGEPELTDSLVIYRLARKSSDTSISAESVPIRPDEDLARIGKRANKHPATDGPQLGFKCLLLPGFSIEEYVSTMYRDLLPEGSKFGGRTILLTTLLQMNDELRNMINHITERLEAPKELVMYSLSALNMEVYNRTDPHHFCRLVEEGRLEVKDVVLGAGR